MHKLTREQFKKLLLGSVITLSLTTIGVLTGMPHQAQAAAADTTIHMQATTSTSQVHAESAADQASRIIEIGKKYLGTPYQLGAAEGNTSEFDCSSFLQYIYKQVGVDLPRSSREQAKAGYAVSKSDLQPGDLIFSDTNNDGVINHVSMYIGNDQLLQTYKKGIGVTISQFQGSVWDRNCLAVRRVL